MTTFQPMPELTDDQYAALREDIAANGVIVPVVVDQHGRTLDGHNRQRIAAELDIDCPTEVREVANDDAAMDLALTLNCARRHLTREQVREVIRSEIARRPDDSDRAIAKRVGCSPTTVGAVRREGVSNLDTAVTREEAEQRVTQTREHLTEMQKHLMALGLLGMSMGVSAAEIVRAVRDVQRSYERRCRGALGSGGVELFDVFRTAVFEPVIDALLEPAAEAEMATVAQPATDEERRLLLDGIVMIGLPQGEHPADCDGPEG